MYVSLCCFFPLLTFFSNMFPPVSLLRHCPPQYIIVLSLVIFSLNSCVSLPRIYTKREFFLNTTITIVCRSVYKQKYWVTLLTHTETAVLIARVQNKIQKLSIVSTLSLFEQAILTVNTIPNPIFSINYYMFLSLASFYYNTAVILKQ